MGPLFIAKRQSDQPESDQLVKSRTFNVSYFNGPLMQEEGGEGN